MNELAVSAQAKQGDRSLDPLRTGPAVDPTRLLEAPPPFIELLPVAAFACDALGRICWFNSRAAALWGRHPATGEHGERFSGAHRLLDHDGRALRRDRSPTARVLKTGRAVAGEEVRLERPDGSQAVAMIHIDPLRDASGSVVGAISCFHEITELKETQARRDDSERHFRELLEALPAAVYTTDEEGRITFYNDAAVALWGCRPELGRSQWCGSWRLYWADGRPMRHDECPMAVALQENRPVRGSEALAERPDGTLVPFVPYPTPLHDGTGRLIGAVNMLIDISERKKTDAQHKVLLDELNHRVKNTLATVQSLAAQTFRESVVPREVRQAFDGRLLALSKAHDHLARGQWERADLRSILYDVFSPYRNGTENRIRLAGPAIKLAPRQALIMAMVLHELAANAAKFGSLSVPQGVLTVSWAVRNDLGARRLQVDWEESGGPEVQPPLRRGFGSRFVERSIATELKGLAAISFDPAGLRCNVSLPLSVRLA